MVGCRHSETLEFPERSDRYGGWAVGEKAKTTGFSGGNARGKKRGCGTNQRKKRKAQEKRNGLWFIPPEMTRINA